MIKINYTILGFLFALLLFYLQETYRKHQTQKELIKYLNREIEYNVTIINQWIKDIRHNIYTLSWAEPIFAFTPNFNKFRSFFINKAFDSGIIYDLLSDRDIESLSIMLTSFSLEKQSYIKNFISNYKDVGIMDKYGMSGIDHIKIFLNGYLEIFEQTQKELNQIIRLIKHNDNQLLQRVKKLFSAFEGHLFKKKGGTSK